MAHTATCPTCKAAGRGYGERCATGQALWGRYDAATLPDHLQPRTRPAPRQIDPALSDLLDAAMLACGYHHDNAQQRQQMIDDCNSVSASQRRALAAYFLGQYKGAGND